MKGFIVKLIPLDPTGVQRNKDFLEQSKGKLMAGGKAELQADGALYCRWEFSGVIPDIAKRQMLLSFTNSLDKAISKKTNVRYDVEFIEDDKGDTNGPLG
jgi:hypothetical protein